MLDILKGKLHMSLDEFKAMKKQEKLCVIVLLLQIAFIAYTNMFMVQNTLDNDAAKLFLHAVEIWKNKKIFLPNWSNMTTLEIDCAALLAMPFYGLTKNLYLSFTLSNLSFAIIYIYLFSILLKRVYVSKQVRIITYIFLLIPFSFGQLFYYNMMFFSGGQYVVKVLVPLMYIVVLTSDGIGIRENVVALISALLTLIMGISSGPYIFVTGVVPVTVAYLIYECIYKQKLKDFICYKSFYIAVVGFMAVLGELICLKKHVNTTGNSLTLVSGSDLIYSFLDKILEFFEIYGGFSHASIPILSIDGLLMAYKYIVALVIFIVTILAVIHGVKNSKSNKVIAYVSTLFVVNYVIVLFTASEGVARYLLVFLVPSMLLMALYVEKRIKSIGDKRETLVVSYVVVFLILIELLVSDFQVLTDRAFPDVTHENRKYIGIVELLKEQPEGHVFVMNDNGQPELYRILDFNGEKEYLVFLTDTQTIEVHDYYWSDEYYNWLNEGFLLVGCDTNTSIDMMPEDIANRSEKIGSVQNYSIYRVSPAVSGE